MKQAAFFPYDVILGQKSKDMTAPAAWKITTWHVTLNLIYLQSIRPQMTYGPSTSLPDAERLLCREESWSQLLRLIIEVVATQIRPAKKQNIAPPSRLISAIGT